MYCRIPLTVENVFKDLPFKCDLKVCRKLQSVKYVVVVSCVLDLHSTTQVVSRLHVTVFCVKVVQSKSVLKLFIASRKSLSITRKPSYNRVHNLFIKF